MPDTLRKVKPIKLNSAKGVGANGVPAPSKIGNSQVNSKADKTSKKKNKHKKSKRKRDGFVKTLYALVDAALYLYQANKAYRLEQGIGVRKEYERIRKSLILEKSTIATMQSQFQAEVDALLKGEVLSFTIQLNPDVAKYFDIIKNAVEYKYLVFDEVEPLKYRITMDESYMKEWNF